MTPLAAVIAWRTAVHGAREQQHRDWTALETVVLQAALRASEGNLKQALAALDVAEGLEYGLVGNCDAVAGLRAAIEPTQA